VDSNLREIFGKDYKKKNDYTDDVEAVNELVDAGIEDFFAKNKRSPSATELDDLIVKPLLAKGIVEKGWLFNSKKRGYQLKEGENFIDPNAKEAPKPLREIPLDEPIPELEKALIVDALREKGGDISEEAIQRTWKRYKKAQVNGK
jgi:hypothetical protein